jgi:hypothetical protein
MTLFPKSPFNGLRFMNTEDIIKYECYTKLFWIYRALCLYDVHVV